MATLLDKIEHINSYCTLQIYEDTQKISKESEYTFCSEVCNKKYIELLNGYYCYFCLENESCLGYSEGDNFFCSDFCQKKFDRRCFHHYHYHYHRKPYERIPSRAVTREELQCCQKCNSSLLIKKDIVNLISKDDIDYMQNYKQNCFGDLQRISCQYIDDRHQLRISNDLDELEFRRLANDAFFENYEIEQFDSLMLKLYDMFHKM